MKIAILTSGTLPVPAVQGGAVENLIDTYLEYNDIHKLHDITIYSVYHPDVDKHPALKSEVNHYKYVNTESFIYKIKRKFYSYKSRGFYNDFIEFFFEQSYALLKRNHYDLIILENRPGYAIKLGERLPTPIIAHIHFDMLNNPQNEYIFKNVKGIIAVSNYLYSKASVSIRNRCKTVYNGIDLNSFKKKEKQEINSIKNSLKIENDDIVLVYSGRITQIKGVKELIEAIALLNNKKIKLLVLGGVLPSNDYSAGEYENSIKVAARPIYNQIIFAGVIPYQQVPVFLSICDIAIVPSLCDDAFPTTILEALAIGLPIIATNRGGIPEQVTKDSAILISSEGDVVKEISEAIKFLLENPEKRKKMGEASHLRAKQFNKELYTENFFKVINDFINTNKK